jgi:membrane protein
MGLVFGVGLLLVLAVVGSVVLASLSGWIGLGDVPVLNTLLSFILITLLFGLLYKILPDAYVSWRSAGRSAALAAVAVAAGLELVNLYFRYVRLDTALSVAGGLAVILIGMNYGAQIFLFGAVVSRILDLLSVDPFGPQVPPDDRNPRKMTGSARPGFRLVPSPAPRGLARPESTGRASRKMAAA